MSLFPAALLLVTALDGEAALRHASSLAALGPHPWGSPRARVAAEYVAAQLREAGLSEVRLQEFELQGTRGTNAIGVLRAQGPELVVVGAHHDSAPPASHGAYDDGGGVGILIEMARVLAREKARPRTIIFASWDAEEAGALGSRAYVRSLGSEARNIVAGFDLEMCGWAGGRPVFHPIAYADPLRPGRYVVTPEWLIRAAQNGAREAGAPLGLGDPLLAWVYQPAVRTFRVGLYGDDLSFLQAGLPAVFASDSSFAYFYPWYHESTDTADKVDAASLARMGRGALGVVASLARVPRGPASEPHWFSAFGHVAGWTVLMTVGALSLVPGLLAALAPGGLALAARILHAALFGVLLWRHPVPALWVFLLPNVVTAFSRRGRALLLAALPLVALLVLGAAAWNRGMVSGTWLAPWDVLAAGAGLVLVIVRAPTRIPVRGKKAPRRGR